MDLRVALQERSARPYVWLDVSYNGKRPPLDLFADLAMVGWKPPAPAPPPRSAIDWSTPDPITGDPFTIGDYQIDDVIGAPPGTGDRGRWTAGERVAYLRGLEGVLARYDLSTRPAPPDAVPVRPAPPVSAPVTPNQESTGVESDDMVVAAGGTMGDAASGEVSLVLVEAPLVPGTRQLVLQALASLDIPARVESREHTRTVQYRGANITSSEVGQILTSIVMASEVSRVVAVLLNAGAVADEEAVTFSSVRPEALTSFLRSPADEPPVVVSVPLPGASPPTTDPANPAVTGTVSETPAGTPTGTVVTLVVEAGRYPFLREVIEDAGGRLTQATRTKVTRRIQHRGSFREDTVPGVRLMASIGRDQLDALLVGLQDAGVAIDDPTQASFDALSPVAASTTPAAAGTPPADAPSTSAAPLRVDPVDPVAPGSPTVTLSG